jgi:hypothetical protein
MATKKHTASVVDITSTMVASPAAADSKVLDLVDGIETRMHQASAVVWAFACALDSERMELRDKDPGFIATCVDDLLREAHDLVEELREIAGHAHG